MTESEEKHEQKYLPIDLICPNSWNPQIENEETFERLVDEIKPGSTGFIETITVVPIEDGMYRIISGEHRWMAAKKAGLEEVPCLILKGTRWSDVDLQKFVTVRLNVIRGKMDPAKFIKLYNELLPKYDPAAMQGLMGILDQKAFTKLVVGLKKDMRKSLPGNLADEFDQQAKEAKSLKDLEHILQTLFAKYGDTIKYSFMIFTHGKQEHIYIALDRKMALAMKKVTDYCQLTKTDINTFMAPLTNEYVKEVTKRLERASAAAEGRDLLLEEEDATAGPRGPDLSHEGS